MPQIECSHSCQIKSLCSSQLKVVHPVYRMLNTDSNTGRFLPSLDPQETKLVAQNHADKIKQRLDMNHASPGDFALSQSGGTHHTSRDSDHLASCSTLCDLFNSDDF